MNENGQKEEVLNNENSLEAQQPVQTTNLEEVMDGNIQTEQPSDLANNSVEGNNLEAPKPEGKSNKKKIIICSIVGCIFLILIGLLIVINTQNNEQEVKQSSKKTEETTSEQESKSQDTAKKDNSNKQETYFNKEFEDPTAGKKNKISQEKIKFYREHNALSDFDLSFLKLENNNKNKIYSPLSIKYALEMIKDGADKNSYKEINTLLEDYQPRKYENNDHMSFANAMFIRNSFKDKIENNYIKELDKNYSAEVIYDDFNNADTINQWVDKKTLNLINKLVDDDAAKDANFYLVNALAINMNWTSTLQCDDGRSMDPNQKNIKSYYYHVYYRHEKYSDYVETVTSGDPKTFPDMIFNNIENTQAVKLAATFNKYDIINTLGEENIRKTVGDAYREWLEKNPGDDPDVDKVLDQYIKEIGENYGKSDISSEYSIYVDDDVKLFAKELQTYMDGITLEYVGIMPKNESLDSYINHVTAAELKNYIANLKEVKYENFKEGVVTRITGMIPLFKFDYELNLKKDLQSLGIQDVFDTEKADLSKMCSKEKQYIFDTVHKAEIEFSNIGIKAAAATAGGGRGATSGGFDYIYDIPIEEIDITFDKPYIFLIRDQDTGEIWFAGTVYEANKK